MPSVSHHKFVISDSIINMAVLSTSTGIAGSQFGHSRFDQRVPLRQESDCCGRCQHIVPQEWLAKHGCTK